MCMRTHGGPLEGSRIVRAPPVGILRNMVCIFTGGGPREGGRGVRPPPLGSIMPGGAVLLKAQGREIDP